MAESRPCITVLAGTNGAGKSSVAGAALSRGGGVFFNPDEAARRIRSANPGLTLVEANSAAWHEGKRLLERAIAERKDLVLESTLGATTIPSLLKTARAAGIEVRIWYVALESPELHIARVRARVSRGGHDIPEMMIRERYDSSRRNLIDLLPGLTELQVFDNSAEGDPAADIAPAPELLLHWLEGSVISMAKPADMPVWAKPIAAAAIKAARKKRDER